MDQFTVEIPGKGFIKELKFPADKSVFTFSKKNAFRFVSKEYIQEKLRGTVLDNYIIEEVIETPDK